MPEGLSVATSTTPASPRPRQPARLPGADTLFDATNNSPPIIPHAKWNRARSSILENLAAGPKLIVLLGPPGSGKTLLLRELAAALEGQGRTVALCEFGDAPPGAESADVLLVDEADRISAARINDLRSRRPIPMVLAALPVFTERCQELENPTIVPLAPLTTDEACAFIAKQLAQLRIPPACLTEDAWAELIHDSAGIPRRLAGLLKFALFIAADEGAERVTGSHVRLAFEAQSGGMGKGAGERPGPSEGDRIPRLPADTSSDRTPIPAIPSPIAAGAVSMLPAQATQARAGQSGLRRRISWEIAAGVGIVALLALLMNPRLVRHESATAPPPTPIQHQSSSAPGTTPAARQTDPAPVPSATPAQAAAPPADTAALPRKAAALPSEPPAPAPPAATAPDGPPLRLMAGPSIRIVLTYWRADAAAEKRGFEAARMLRQDGFDVSDPFPLPQAPVRGISYFFAQDGDAAATIGSYLDASYGPPRLVRVPSEAGLPRPGTIEIAIGP